MTLVELFPSPQKNRRILLQKIFSDLFSDGALLMTLHDFFSNELTSLGGILEFRHAALLFKDSISDSIPLEVVCENEKEFMFDET